jgi:hypothetical protein
MKKNNKSWVRQLSESYIRQALNENDMHQTIDDAHARTVPEHAGKVKAFLDAHVAKTGKPLDHEGAVGLVVDRFVDGNPDWEAAAGGSVGNQAGDYFPNNIDLYMNHLLDDTK